MQFGSDMDETVPQRPLWPVPWKKQGHKPPEVIPADRPDKIRQQRKVALDEFMVIVNIDSNEINPPVALNGGKRRREITLVNDPWNSSDQAARQLASIHHRGPRQRFYPGSYDLTMNGCMGRNGHDLKPRPAHF